MTREEAIKYLRQIYPNGGHCWLDEQRVEALDMAIQALSVSLPEGLDEAAGEYLDGHKPLSRYNWGDLMDAFKAGAEWDRAKMLEGAVEGEICGRVYDHINVRFADGICKYLEPKNISHIPADVSKFKVGDKVRIIIVKEDEK